MVPLYCFDPRHFGTTPYGSKKTGDYRAKFLLESVQDLKQRLISIGSNLLIHMGRPEDALIGKSHVQTYSKMQLLWHLATDSRRYCLSLFEYS